MSIRTTPTDPVTIGSLKTRRMALSPKTTPPGRVLVKDTETVGTMVSTRTLSEASARLPAMSWAWTKTVLTPSPGPRSTLRNTPGSDQGPHSLELTLMRALTTSVVTSITLTATGISETVVMSLPPLSTSVRRGGWVSTTRLAVASEVWPAGSRTTRINVLLPSP